MREPFFGPNAKPIFIQTVIGVTIYVLAYLSGIGDVVKRAILAALNGTP